MEKDPKCAKTLILHTTIKNKILNLTYLHGVVDILAFLAFTLMLTKLIPFTL